MTAADGDDGDRPAGDESRTDASSDASAEPDEVLTDGGERATDSDADSQATADGGEVTAEGGEVTPERPGSSSEVSVPDSEEGFEGAPDDQEMPLTEHIEEMLGRMLAVAIVMGGVALLVFPIADSVINFLWYSFLPAPAEGIETCGTASDGACPRVYHPLALLLARLKVASLAGLIVALPVFVYQTYLFMRPGLYPNERRYYLAAVPTSLVLALVGVAFAYFLILPVIFVYFLNYSEGVADIAFALTETFDLIILMMGLFALIFQIPLFIMLAIMMGVTTREWLEGRRLLFWFSFGGVAFLFSPDPTGMAPLLVALTMIVLFEFTLALLRWTGR
jgi:sec-independent protein translocase protein TatC